MIENLHINEFAARRVGGVTIDVRTCDEYARGHIPCALNLPLFTPEQRAEVGTLYMRTSRAAAIEHGLEAAGGKLADFVRQARQMSSGGEKRLYIYCARGGMRSSSMAWLLDMAGFKVSLLKGGYKAYRGNLETVLNGSPWKFVIVSGATGSGKSEFLALIQQAGQQVIDLEGLAHHKGSAFGHLGQIPQPTSEHFINLIHESMRAFDPQQPIWCEGESMLIGRLYLPKTFFDIMQSAPRIEVKMDVEQRLDRLTAEYGQFSATELADAFNKIAKRLGYDNVKKALEFIALGDVRSAARIALIYYDKAYARSAPDVNFIKCDIDNNDMAGSALKLIQAYENS